MRSLLGADGQGSSETLYHSLVLGEEITAVVVIAVVITLFKVAPCQTLCMISSLMHLSNRHSCYHPRFTN